ncbi:Hypothetical protein LBF_0579 [Leptospira biflexa serovar Patoc strain 'Patoc 1 (Ames)']|uniref:Lipoprotein n=1 Tax=Leptospira biflexa serovar Patoc (strain Patoc 1 / ATCC 23582 / Paris) TaxID=456481 RepID=B0SKI0_LEPBP|nr:hypothetical protein [Leptospira biflexa]ABZ93115.1 Hypothetical protein LBF_0579 [Leptospira biflexa serovar Patoc strain 'Patoc 1 (Ames)']ABZ96737.1 Hypothetical protein; putative membrane protein [Leptospira biflexa serovar Patoc strain 'Patoc 1 (Paris)']
MNLKEKPSSKWIIIISVSCLGILLNCISFVKYENPNLKNTPTPELQEKKTVLLKYYGDYLRYGKHSTYFQDLIVLKESMIETIKDTNLFLNVITNENEAHDYVMYIESDLDDKSSLGWAFFSGLTFMVFPLIVDVDVDVKISLYDLKNKQLSANQEKIHLDLYGGWLLIPATPFFFSPSVERKAYKNIIFSSINQWKTKGIIK